MLIGYVRVSTDDQSLNLQRDALEEIGCEEIFQDQMSGAKAERPGLKKALEYARAGDTLIVWRLDRLSRSLKDLIAIVTQLESKRIELKSVQESIDTSSSAGKLIFHLFGALAEFKRNLIRERTQAGLLAARARGRKGGWLKALNRRNRDLVVKLYNEKNLSVNQVCEVMDFSKPTLYKYVHASKSRQYISKEISDSDVITK